MDPIIIIIMQCVRIKIVFALYNTPECGKKLKTCAIQKWSCNVFKQNLNKLTLHKYISNFTQLNKTTHVPIKSKLHILQKLKQMDCSFIWKLWIAVSIKIHCKIHYTDTKERDTMAHNGKKLYYLPLSVLALSLETLGYPSCLYRASMTIKTLYYPTDAQIYNL